MKIGYARVSTADQTESIENQRHQLTQHGCEKIFVDIASGIRTHQPGLQATLEYARENDSIVVTRLDRLGRSTVDILHTVQDLDQRGIAIEALDTH